MLKSSFPFLSSLWRLGVMRTRTQQRSKVLMQLILDVSIFSSTHKAVYVSNNILHPAIQREDGATTADTASIVAVGGMGFMPTGHNVYLAVILQTVTPASYLILLRIVDVKGLRTVRWGGGC